MHTANPFALRHALLALGVVAGVAVSAEREVAQGREPLSSAAALLAPHAATQPVAAKAPVPPAPEAGRPQVRIVGIQTDVAKRYKAIVPPIPTPPFNGWRVWLRNHEISVHCALEWCNEKGEWFHGELRSTHFDKNAELYRVGWGEFPGTAFDAYGIYIMPGRVPRDKDRHGRDLVVSLDEEVPCDYRRIEEEIRRYGAKYARSGDEGTGGTGRTNVGLGGPAYKPSQNSNTMIKYVLRACGYTRKAPDLAVGWDSEPDFPYSSNADAPQMETP